MLLVDENDTVEVVVRYYEKPSGLDFLDNDEKACEGIQEEKFVFRRPNWDDWKAINTDIVSVSDTGSSSINLHKFIDHRMKTLLKSWTLKTADGTPLPIVGNIGKLKPALVTYLNRRLEEKLSPAENEPLAGS
jgi:hypothetical protein